MVVGVIFILHEVTRLNHSHPSIAGLLFAGLLFPISSPLDLYYYYHYYILILFR